MVNCFSKIMNDKIAEKFNVIFKERDFKERDEMMEEMRKFITNAANKINGKTSGSNRFADELLLAYQAGSFEKNSLLMVMEILNRNTNFWKLYDNYERFKLCIDDLYSVINRSGFYFDGWIPDLVNATMTNFGLNEKIDHNGINLGNVYLIYLSLLAKYMNPFKYTTRWYILINMKTISILSYYTKKELELNPQVKDMVAEFYKVLVLLNNRTKEDKDKRDKILIEKEKRIKAKK